MNIKRILHEHMTEVPFPTSDKDRQKASDEEIRRLQVANDPLIQEILQALRVKLAERAATLFNLSQDPEKFPLNGQNVALEGRVIQKTINLIENDKYE